MQARRRIKAQQQQQVAGRRSQAAGFLSHGVGFRAGSWAIRRAISRPRSIAVSEHACNSMHPAPPSPPPSANPRRPPAPASARDGSLGPLTLTSSSHLANHGPSAAHPARHAAQHHDTLTHSHSQPGRCPRRLPIDSTRRDSPGYLLLTHIHPRLTLALALTLTQRPHPAPTNTALSARLRLPGCSV